MTILDGYANADRPDYAHFRKLLSLAAESMSANVEEDFDWQQKPKVVEKNTPVAKEKSADGENENAKASSEKMSKEVLNKDKEKTTSREEQKNEDSQGDSDSRPQDPFSNWNKQIIQLYQPYIRIIKTVQLYCFHFHLLFFYRSLYVINIKSKM